MAGRPKKQASQTKSYTLRIRMTQDQRALLEEAAQTRGLETSTWARSELIALAQELAQTKERAPHASSAKRKHS
jgi:uncharacterized protein (DUF1778 family)